MKRQTRTLLALALSAQMIFSLTACGSKKSDTNGSNTDANGNAVANSDSGSSSSNSGSRIVSESDPYYNVTTSSLQANVAHDKEIQMSNIVSHYIVGDRILAEVFVSYVMPEEILKEQMDLDLYDEAQMARYDEISDEYEDSSLQMFDLDGKFLTEIELENGAVFSGAFSGKDGEILLVTNKVNLKDCKATPSVSVYSSSGEKLRDIALQVDDDLMDVRLYVLDNGNMLVASIGKFWILDGEGKVLSEESNPELNGMVLHSGGKWFAVMPDYSSYDSSIYVQEIDTDSGKLAGRPFKCSEAVLYARQGEQDCFLLNANGIDKFDIETQTKTQVLAWKDTDVNSSTLNLMGARIASENDMIFFQFDAIGDGGRGSMDLKSEGASLVSVVHLSKADKNPHAGKTRLRLGINEKINGTFLEQVLTYNKDPQNTARIEVIDYTADAMDSGDSDEVENALLESTNQLVMDMLSGNGPDILVGYSELSQFNSDTMLVDLNSLIDSDGSFNRDDYYDNILRSFETDGKLYTIPLTYTLEGMAVNTSFNGAKENWTFAEFDQMASSLSPDVQPIASQSPDELLKLWMKSLSSHFIDVTNKTVDFESEEFRTLLETVKKYGKGNDTDYDWDLALDTGYVLNDASLFRKNMVASTYISISDLETYASLCKEGAGHTVAFSGVPSLSGMGMVAKGQLSMAITASCGSPDLAWDFIRSFLSEDAQHDLSFNTDTLPINKNAYKKNCQIEIEVNQKFLERLKGKAGQVAPEVLETAVEISQTHIDSFEKLISGITSSQSWDSDVMNIILEESAGFFAGQRSIDDVCGIIQNRATLVVQER